MTENMNCSRKVTIAIFWIDDTDTMTAWMTVFKPLARLMARRGLKTLRTLKIWMHLMFVFISIFKKSFSKVPVLFSAILFIFIIKIPQRIRAQLLV